MENKISTITPIDSNPQTKINQIVLSHYIFSEHIINNYSDQQTIALTLRNSLIDWLYIISKSLTDPSDTFFTALSLLDTFISKSQTKLDKDQIQLYAAICYFISKKLHNVVLISPTFLATSILKDKYTINDINKAEIEVMKELNFRLSIDTVQSYTDVFIEHLTLPLEKTDFLEMNTCVNIFSLHVLEIVFEFSPLQLSLITFKSSLILFANNNVLQEDEVEEVNMQMKEFLGENLYESYVETEEMAKSLCETFISKLPRLQQKAYFQWYLSAFD